MVNMSHTELFNFETESNIPFLSLPAALQSVPNDIGIVLTRIEGSFVTVPGDWWS